MDEKTGWMTAAAALLAPVAVVVGRWWDRRDKADSREADWREKREASLYQRQDAQLDRCWKRVAELEAEMDRLEADRDRGWSLARAWSDRCHDLRHEFMNAIHVSQDERLIARPPAPLPPLQGIAPVAAPKDAP